MVKTVSREKKMGVCPFIKLRPKTLIGCGPLLCPWHVTEVRITPPREKMAQVEWASPTWIVKKRHSKLMLNTGIALHKRWGNLRHRF